MARRCWPSTAPCPAAVILGTGPEQPEAVALYGKTGYERIASFAPEPWRDLVHCFEKRL